MRKRLKNVYMVNSKALPPKLIGIFYNISYLTSYQKPHLLPDDKDFSNIYKSTNLKRKPYKHYNDKKLIYDSLFFFPCGLAEYGEYKGVKCTSNNVIDIHSFSDFIKYYYTEQIFFETKE